MSDLMRVQLGGGGEWIAFRAESIPEGGVEDGPQPAGRGGKRLGDGLVEASVTLQEALQPVVSMSRVVLAELRAAAPHEVEVEFGVELSAEAGVVIARAAGACHLKVRLTWGGENSGDLPSGT
ncbi:MAG: CU044_2847 family protein [Nocardioides sp.]